MPDIDDDFDDDFDDELDDEFEDEFGGGADAPDLDTDFDRDAGPWLDLIKDAEDAFETYQDKCDNIDKQLADLDRLAKGAGDREFQIFWANLEVLKPSIYARPPAPAVTPRFRSRAALSTRAAEMLERALATSFETEEIDEVMRLVRDDLAVGARGALWLRYEAEGVGATVPEKVAYDHVDRRDFLHDPARKWREVDWVARRSWLTRSQGVARFGDAFVHAEFKQRDAGKEDEFKGEEKAQVWELWHKTRRAVVWVTPGLDEVLDIRPPFLSLDRFFPCPKPAYATVQRGSLQPVPDFLYYKDQVEEINELTARISALAEALRLKGFYAGGSEDLAAAIEAALTRTDQNAILIPVSNFAALGGQALKDSIIWLPIQEVADTIRQLLELRRQLIDDVFQITGLSDIMRGTTEAGETLGAQQLKTEFGSVRVRDKQAEMVRIARDAARIAAEIIAENFQPATLVSMSQITDLPTAAAVAQQIQQIEGQVAQAAQSAEGQVMIAQNPAGAGQVAQAVQAQIQTLQNTVTLDAVIALLRAERVRPFVLDIQTDSTIRFDENAARQRATEFVAAIGGFMQQSLPVVREVPEAAPLVTELLKFTAGQFRAGRALNGAIDDFAGQVTEAAARPRGPTPEQQKVLADIEVAREALTLQRENSAADREVERERIAARRLEAAAAAKPETVVTMPESMREEAEQMIEDLELMMARQIETQERTSQLQAESLGAAVQAMAQAAAAMAQAAAALGAPKRVVFDDTGRPVGVETVVN